MMALARLALVTMSGRTSFAVTLATWKERGAAIALDKGQHGFLRGGFAESAVLRLAADIGFIDLDNAIRATHAARCLVGCHRAWLRGYGGRGTKPSDRSRCRDCA